jgi:hypothetical protein
MKKIISLIVLIAFVNTISFGQQYFQGGFSPVTNGSGQLTDSIVFKMKSTGGSYVGAFSYIECAFKYLTAQAPTLSISAPVCNTSIFPSASSVEQVPDVIIQGDYTIVRFVCAATIASRTYNQDEQYVLFKIKLSQTPTPAMNIQMASAYDPSGYDYAFVVVGDAGTVIEPGSGAQLYGSDSTSVNGSGSVYNAPLLPLKFLSFDVKDNNNNGSINWTVGNQTFRDTKSYEIQRSIDGASFQTIGSITANEIRPINSYTYTDKNINLIKCNGQLFYRVKGLDKDNFATFTDIKNIKVDNAFTTFTVFPNPTSDKATLNFELESAQEITIVVLDANGRKLNSFAVQGKKGTNTPVTINMNNYSKGNYFVNIISASSVKTVKVVKQ